MIRSLFAAVVAFIALGSSGCATGILWAHKQPEVEAVSLNPADGHLYGKETGMPFYLPKPLLIVSKNFRNLEEPKTGLTDSPPIPTTFDDQAKFADLNARTNFTEPPAKPGDGKADPATQNGDTSTSEKSGPYMYSSGGAPLSPGSVPGDGLKPDTFYTYQIVFVPDMTQKYGLKIHGGAGELRAAMNLVNGWQFTGIGPFYMKDSATAQNILATGISARLGGQAAADVMHAAADLAKQASTLQNSNLPSNSTSVQRISRVMAALPLGCTPMVIPNFAEVHVYEPNLTPDGRMNWTEIVHLCFDRNVLGTEVVDVVPVIPAAAAGANPADKTQPGTLANSPTVSVDTSVARAAVESVFGIPAGSRALKAIPPTTQSGELQATPAATVNQINIGKGVSRDPILPRFGDLCPPEKPRPQIQSRTISAPGYVVNTTPAAKTTDPKAKPGVAGEKDGEKKDLLKLGTGDSLQNATLPDQRGPSLPVLNQTFNQYVNPQPSPAVLGTPVPKS